MVYISNSGDIVKDKYFNFPSYFINKIKDGISFITGFFQSLFAPLTGNDSQTEASDSPSSSKQGKRANIHQLRSRTNGNYIYYGLCVFSY
jgi:hypothetical protein